MIGNTLNDMPYVERIPEGWSVVSLRLPVSVPNLGTWYAPAHVKSPDGQVVWRLLKVSGSPLPNTVRNLEIG